MSDFASAPWNQPPHKSAVTVGSIEEAERQARHQVTERVNGRTSGDIDATLTERGSRYGKFEDNAAVTMRIMQVIEQQDGWPRFTWSQQLATQMIVHKLARALTGAADYDDNWRDIAGYAELIVKQLNGKNP